MKVLELFAGTRSIGKAFEAKGHEVFSIEWDKSFDNISLYADIMTVTANDILQKFGRPDVIWASPDCTTFSIAAISHHRRQNPATGNLDPVSEYAEFCDAVDQHVLRLIMALSPKYWFIENPRGGLRKMTWMQELPRYTVTYCQYELDKLANERRMKPTDIWTNHPDPKFLPMCHNGAPCHAAAPRGAKTGTQGLKGSKERSVIPEALCQHIVDICEKQIIVDCLNMADHIFAGGVIVLPVKVWQTVYVLDTYYLGRWELFECKVKSIDVYETNMFLELTSIKGCFKWGKNVSEINSTVFLTKEEAEKALADIYTKKE